MSNTSGEDILSNRLPQGLTQEQFALLSLKLRQGVSHLGNDMRVHGSRADGSARPDSDIDIAIRVTPERFNEIINDPELSSLANPNTGSSLENTKLHAIAVGKITAGRVWLRPLRRELARELKMKVDLSVIRIGGEFDRGPWIIVP
ncbi:MAG: nucleotidyltransferase domain-containing protein [Hormoscilla sp. SP5CHS1]|nr:nucleotidyltransferase domain-containing protein [Hormoscilla sp. SP5CHS1]